MGIIKAQITDRARLGILEYGKIFHIHGLQAAMSLMAWNCEFNKDRNTDKLSKIKYSEPVSRKTVMFNLDDETIERLNDIASSVGLISIPSAIDLMGQAVPIADTPPHALSRGHQNPFVFKDKKIITDGCWQDMRKQGE